MATTDVIYSALVLTSESKLKLMTKIKMLIDIPGDWSIVCDHMTICMGPLGDTEKQWYDDGSAMLNIDAIGYGDGITAVRVSDHVRKDKGTPHITIAYDIKRGVAPKDANKITNWVPLQDSFYLNAVVTEFRPRPAYEPCMGCCKLVEIKPMCQCGFFASMGDIHLCNCCVDCRNKCLQ